MALHALGYCERLFYLEEVENLRVADERVYAGRRLHVEIERGEGEGEWLTLALESERWGLVGKVDCVRRRDGMLIPYEHKRGRSARGQDGVAEAWPSDRLQVVAYAALLEEQFEPRHITDIASSGYAGEDRTWFEEGARSAEVAMGAGDKAVQDARRKDLQARFASADANGARPSFEKILDSVFRAMGGLDGLDRDDLRLP